MQNKYQETRTRYCPSEVSAGAAPRLSHVLSTQRRKGRRKRCEFKTSMDTNPRQPQAQGKSLPILLDLKREGKRGTYTATSRAQGELLQLFQRSDAEWDQHWIRQLLHTRGDTAAGHRLMSEPDGGVQLSAGFRAWSSPPASSKLW